jgi:uncharacterized protein
VGEAFGVPQLDRIWSGIPRGSSLLFVNDPGLRGHPFLYQSARHHLEAGRDVVIAVTDRPPSSVTRDLKARGLDLERHRAQLHLLDAYSPLLGMRDPDAWTLPDPNDMKVWGDALAELARRHPDAVLFIESFSTVADQIGIPRFIEGLNSMRPVLERFRMSTVLFTRWPYAEDIKPVQSHFDSVVRLHNIEERLVMNPYFRVEEAQWQQDLDRRPRLYKDLGEEGIVVYIPKVVVTGPFNAGKSTFVQTISETAVSVDRMGTTIALDHGSVLLDGFKIEVFGTPGQSRFDPILKIIAGQSLGIIVVVDASRPDSFERAKTMMDQVWSQGLPVIIAANKQDLDGALTPEEVAKRLDVPSTIQVVGCDAADSESTRNVLRRLVKAIMRPEEEDHGQAIIGGDAA